MALFRVGEFGAAIPPLEQALQLDPALQYAHYHLSLSYFQEQRYPEALGELQRAAQFNPQNAAARFYKDYTLYQRKRYREVLSPFERTIALDPILALKEYAHAREMPTTTTRPGTGDGASLHAD